MLAAIVVRKIIHTLQSSLPVNIYTPTECIVGK